MKKIIVAAALAVAPVILAGASAHAAANTATSAPATVSTTILSPISVSKDADLAFGTVVKPTAGTTTFTVSNAGALSASGGDGAAVASNVHSAAAFTVSGEGAQLFTLSVPTSVTLAGPSSAAIVVTTSNDAGCTTACTLSGLLGGAGSLSFHVGGHFAVDNTQTTGAYSNTTDLTVTATYN